MAHASIIQHCGETHVEDHSRNTINGLSFLVTISRVFQFSTMYSIRAIMYHMMRTDRLGSVIHDMQVAQAFAFSQNWTYGGACSHKKRKYKKQQQQLVNRTRDLLEQLLGPQYDLFLPLACPPSKEEQQAAAAASSTSFVMASRDRKLYRDPVEPSRLYSHMETSCS